MAAPKNITELRDQLLEVFETIKKDPKKTKQATVMVNAGRAILGTVKAQIDYAVLRNEEPEIQFLGKTSGRELKPGVKLLTTP